MENKPQIVRRIGTLFGMEVQVLYATEEEWEKEEVRVNKITDRLNNPENHNKTE